MRKPFEYIKEAWAIYTKRENFGFFAKINAVLLLASLPFSFAIGYFYPTESLQYSSWQPTMLIGLIPLVIISAVVGLWSQTTQFLSVLNMGQKESEVFKDGFKNMGRMLLATLYVGLIVMGGTILLIIPGLLFAVWYSFTLYLVFDKKMGIREAARTSKEMFKGRFWKITGRLCVFSLFGLLVSIVLSLIPFFGSFMISFAVPLIMLPNYLLYRDLSVNN